VSKQVSLHILDYRRELLESISGGRTQVMEHRYYELVMPCLSSEWQTRAELLAVRPMATGVMQAGLSQGVRRGLVEMRYQQGKRGLVNGYRRREITETKGQDGI